MRHDPFAHLDLEQIEQAERNYRAQHPVAWGYAEFVVFVRDPVTWWRSWKGRTAIRYDGRPR